jgi:release factor glutamine methyltransferase
MKKIKYQTRLTPEKFERMREWNERAHLLRKRTEAITYKVRFMTITAFPDVHVGNSPDSLLLSKIVEKELLRGSAFLDMGTGTGLQGITAAFRFAKVTSVDKLAGALACAIYNATENGALSHMEFIQSDGFKNLLGRKFDRIAINPPFRPFKPKDNLDIASNDENYEFMIRFLCEAKQFLNPGGKIWLSFGTSGDIEFLEDLLRAGNYRYKVVGEEASPDEEWRVYKVYEITWEKKFRLFLW